jgi:diguanylate cyclase (GGDEF)-like protein/PAS domain S-box-containing protein
MTSSDRIILVGASPIGPADTGLGEGLRIEQVSSVDGIPAQGSFVAVLLAAEMASLGADAAKLAGPHCPVILLANDAESAPAEYFPGVYRTIHIDGLSPRSVADRIRFTIRTYAAERERDLLRQVVQNASDCILTVEPNGAIGLANNAVGATFGYDSAQLAGAPLETIFVPENPPGSVAEMLDTLYSGGTWSGEVMARRKDGSRLPVHVSLAVARDPSDGSTMTIINARDVTDQQRMLDRLKQLSITDDLTGAYNVRYLWARLRYEFLRARRYDQPISCLMVDLDRFKLVNDNHGHRVGDDVLRLVTKTMSDGIRQVDIIARYGGEEFAVILPNTDFSGALPCADHLRNCVERTPMEVGPLQLKLTVSVGAATMDADVEDEEQLLRRADDALIHAKRSGRNRVCQWTSDISAADR